jgi:hypothetical protein
MNVPFKNAVTSARHMGFYGLNDVYKKVKTVIDLEGVMRYNSMTDRCGHSYLLPCMQSSPSFMSSLNEFKQVSNLIVNYIARHDVS